MSFSIINSDSRNVKLSNPPADAEIFFSKKNEINSPQNEYDKISGIAVKKFENSNNLDQLAPGLAQPTVKIDPKLLNDITEKCRVALTQMTPGESKQFFSDFSNTVRDLKIETKKAGVDITSIANGFTGRAANILQIVIESAQDARNSSTEQREANRKIGYAQGQHAADAKVQAGVDGRNNAITNAVVSSGIVLAGGGTQLKGLNKSNQAQQTHANHSLELRTKADKLSTEAGACRNSRDVDILKSTSKDMRRDAEQESINLTVASTNASKLQVAGGVVSNSGMSAGALASAPGQVTQAESQAEEQMATNNQNVFVSCTESANRMQEAAEQLKVLILQLLSKIMEQHSNTASSMISNLKG